MLPIFAVVRLGVVIVTLFGALGVRIIVIFTFLLRFVLFDVPVVVLERVIFGVSARVDVELLLLAVVIVPWVALLVLELDILARFVVDQVVGFVFELAGLAWVPLLPLEWVVIRVAAHHLVVDCLVAGQGSQLSQIWIALLPLELVFPLAREIWRAVVGITVSKRNFCGCQCENKTFHSSVVV